VRRLTILVMAAALALGAAACGDDDSDGGAGATTTTGALPTTTPANSAAAIPCPNGTNAFVQEVGRASDFTPVTADTLTVVTSLPGPGFWEGSDDNPADVTSGFEYDIAKELQAAFGLGSLVVRNVSFDAIVAGQAQDYDLALSQVTITCERAEVVRFSAPYFFSNQGALVKSDFSKPLATVADAKKIRWGVQSATTALDLLDRIQPDEEPLNYQSLADGYTALQAGQVEAFLIDTAINLGEAARSDGALVVPAQFSQPGGPDQYGAILPADSDDAGAVNAVLEELRTSGKLTELARENLTTDPGTLPVINVP
jgi:polar amino acid transport system substrate-binding protein